MPLKKEYAKLMSKAGNIIESVKSSKILISQKKDTPLPYAYPCGNYMDSILSNGLVRKSLQLFADKYCKEQIQKIKSTGQLVSNSNYPHFYNILQSCYKSLNIEEVPEVYVTDQLKGINALSIGIDSASIILISRKAMISLSDGELKFMIGHELGHIAQKNMICHMIVGMLDGFTKTSDFMGTMFSEIMEIPLKEWARASEYTADRTGLMCCGGIDNVYPLFSRFQKMGSKSLAPRYMELFKDHPTIDNRLKMIYSYYISLSIIENK